MGAADKWRAIRSAGQSPAGGSAAERWRAKRAGSAAPAAIEQPSWSEANSAEISAPPTAQPSPYQYDGPSPWSEATAQDMGARPPEHPDTKFLTVTNTAGRNIPLTEAEADPGPDAGIMERAVHSRLGRSVIEFLQPIGDVEMLGAAPKAAAVLPPPQDTSEAWARQGAKAAGAVTSAIVPSVPQMVGGGLGGVVSRAVGPVGGLVAGVTGFTGASNALGETPPGESRILGTLAAPKRMLEDVVAGPVKAGIEAAQAGPMTPERITEIGEHLQPAVQAVAIPVGTHLAGNVNAKLVNAAERVAGVPGAAVDAIRSRLRGTIDETAPTIRGELPGPVRIPPAGPEYGPPRPEFVEWFRGTYGRDPTPADIRAAMTPDPLRGNQRRSLPAPERGPIVTPPPPVEATPAVPAEFGEWFRGTYGRDPTPTEIRAAATPDPLRGSPRRALPTETTKIPPVQPGQAKPPVERTSLETTGFVPPYTEARGRTVTDTMPQSLGPATPEQQAAITRTPEAFKPPVQESTTSTPVSELTDQQRAFIEKRVQTLGSFEAVNNAYQSGSPVGDYAREVAGQMYELPSPTAGPAVPDQAAPPPIEPRRQPRRVDSVAEPMPESVVINVPGTRVRNTPQERPVAGGADVAPPARPLDAGVPPVVRNEGQPAGDQPGDVAVASPVRRMRERITSLRQKAAAGVQPRKNSRLANEAEIEASRLEMGERYESEQQGPSVVEAGNVRDAGPAGEAAGEPAAAGAARGRAAELLGGDEPAGHPEPGVRLPKRRLKATTPPPGGAGELPEPIRQLGKRLLEIDADNPPDVDVKTRDRIHAQFASDAAAHFLGVTEQRGDGRGEAILKKLAEYGFTKKRGALAQVREAYKAAIAKEIPHEEIQEVPGPGAGGVPAAEEGGQGGSPVEVGGQGPDVEGAGGQGVPELPKPARSRKAPALTPQNPAAFERGQVVRNHGSGERFEVVESNKRGMAKLKNLATGEVQNFNAHNNPFFVLDAAKSEAPPTRRPPPDMGMLPGMSMVSGGQGLKRAKEVVAEGFDRTIRALGLEQATSRLVRQAPVAGKQILERVKHAYAKQARFAGVWNDQLRDVWGKTKLEDANNAAMAYDGREQTKTESAREIHDRLAAFDQRFRQALQDSGVRMVDRSTFRGLAKYLPQRWNETAIKDVNRGRGDYYDKAAKFLTDQFNERRLKYVNETIVEREPGEQVSAQDVQAQVTRFLRDRRMAYQRRFTRPAPDAKVYDAEYVDLITDFLQSYGKEYKGGKIIDNENPPPPAELRKQAVNFIRDAAKLEEVTGGASFDDMLKAGVVKDIQLHRLFQWPREFLVDDLRQAWFDHVNAASKVVARQSAFGFNANALNALASRYVQEVGEGAAKEGKGSPGEAMAHAEDFLKQFTADVLGNKDQRVRQFEASMPKLAQSLRTARSVSAVAQIGPGSTYSLGGNVIMGFFTNAYRHGLASALKSLPESVSKAGRRRVERAGGYAYEFVPELLETSSLPKRAAMAMSGWYKAQEAYIRASSGLAGLDRAKSVIRRLNANPTIDPIDSRFGRELLDLGLTDEQIRGAVKAGELPASLENTVIRAGVENSQPMSRPMDAPHSWSGPVGRLITQYWPAWYQTAQNTIGHALRETGHGNLIPIARLLPMAVAAGWGYKALGDALAGRAPPKSDRDKLARWISVVGNPLGLDTPFELVSPGRYSGLKDMLTPASVSLADSLIRGAVETAWRATTGEGGSPVASMRKALRSFAAYRTGETAVKAVGKLAS